MQRPQDRQRREAASAATAGERHAAVQRRVRVAANRAAATSTPTARITATSTSVEEPSCRPPFPTKAIAASAPASVTQIAMPASQRSAPHVDGDTARGWRHLGRCLAAEA